MSGLGVTRRDTQLWRQLLKGSPLKLKTPDGEDIEVLVGDYIAAILVRQVSSKDRLRLGGVLGARAVSRQSGVRPEVGQLRLRAGGLGGSATRPLGSTPADSPSVGLAVAASANAKSVLKQAADTAHVPVTAIVFEDGDDLRDQVSKLGLKWVAVIPSSGVDFWTGWLSNWFEWESSIPSLADRDADRDGYGVYVCGADKLEMPDLIRSDALRAEDLCGGPVVIADPDVEVPAVSRRAMLAAMRKTGASIVLPLHNMGEPASVPMAGERGSALPRLPGGRSVWDIAHALAADGADAVPGAVPKYIGAALVSMSVAAELLDGKSVNASDAMTACDAYCWRLRDEKGTLAKLLYSGGGGSAPASWPVQTLRTRGAVAAARPRGLPVALYTHAVGPWGGVTALFEVADRLNQLGMSATVVYHSAVDYKHRPRTSPLKIHNPDHMITDPKRHFGWNRGIIVGSHWHSGNAVAQLVKLHGGIVPTTFLQDREDWFEGINGAVHHLEPRHYRQYLDVGRGISVSRWIVDTLASDHGVDPTGYEIIPAGVDGRLFHAAGRAKPGETLRILAMWRPQTALRRGMVPLAECYAELKRRLGGNVSLELFGWKEDTPAATDVHHGVLSPQGVGELMRQVDIVVEPSIFQGFGLPGLEAIACGAALVSTDCRGVHEYGRHRENCLIVPHAELVEGIVEIVEDSKLRLSLQEAGPDSVLEFDWDVIGAKWAINLAALWDAESTDARHDRAAKDAAGRALSMLADR